MDLLYFLEGIRVPVLNEFMLFITQFGEETAFLIAALILFWCVDKNRGYYILSVGFVGTLINQFMKLWFRVPRPWVLDRNFTILEQAREAASGYSFPSGHTQSAVGTFGGIAYTTKNRCIRAGACVIAVLVPFSRMYIGVHTPLDVCTAAAIAIALIIIVKPLIYGNNGKAIPVLLGIMSALCVAFLCYVTFYHFPEDVDAHNLASGVKNAYTLFGALFGLLAVYIVDKKWLNFSTKAIWWAQVLKVIAGLVLVLAVKSGLKTPLNLLLGESFGRAARYFLLVIVAGILWPLSFKWFAKLGIKEKKMAVVLFVFFALLLLTLVSGAYVFVVGCVRKKDLPWLIEEEIKKTPYGKYYDHIRASNQWLSEHDARDVYITSNDGLKLHGLWIPAENPIGTVLLSHGYRSTYLVDFGLAFDFYHKRGMNLLIPEQRSHGKSQGHFITFGIKECRDMQSWIDFHNRNLGKFPMILSGLSMGASTVLYLADKKLPENVRGIIADCGFTSPKDILSSVFTNVTHLPAIPSIWAAELYARIFAGFSLYQYDTRKTLSKNRLPIIMIHGMDDGFVPCRMTEEAYAACVGPKQLLLVEGADHGVSFLLARDRYTALVEEFIQQNINKGEI